MSKMHPKSDAIYDPKTGEILKYSELLKGNKVVMPSGYSMHPQSGTLLAHDGTELDLVELLLGSGGGSPTNAMTSVSISASGDSYEFKNASSAVVGAIPLVTNKDIDNILNSLN